MGTPVIGPTIRDWMDAEDYRLRKIRKDIPIGTHPERNAQFENIAELMEDYEAGGNPWFSMDTKRKNTWEPSNVLVASVRHRRFLRWTMTFQAGPMVW